ncbi:MAG TPA: hypothetical protein VFS43_44125 [Polyangiaceae bacterium]|nr:hypothetical protein [Polyangiaceae bacterium]
MMEMQDELRAVPWPRAPMPTIGYHEAPLDRGDARVGTLPPEPPMTAAARAFDPRNASAPDIEVSLTDVSLRALTALDGSEPLDDAADAADGGHGAGGRLGPAVGGHGAGDAAGRRLGPDDGGHGVGRRLGPDDGGHGAGGRLGPDDGGGTRLGSDDEGAHLGSDDDEGDELFTPRAIVVEGGVRATAPAGVQIAGKALPFEAFELRSFVVPSSALGPRVGGEQKVAFVRAHFASLLPCPADRVRRVDTRVLEAGALMLLVWCPIG